MPESWALSQKHALSSAMLEGMPDATVLVTASGVIVYANRRVEDLLGWVPGELVGEHVEILTPASVAHHHVALRDGFFRDPTVRSMGSGLELDARHRDGSLIPVEIALSPLDFDEEHLVIAAIRDVRAPRALRHNIVEERNRAQAVIDALPDGVLEFDIEASRYVTVNPRFCDLVGLTRAEVLAVTGTPPWWDPAEVEQIRDFRTQAGAGKPIHFEMQFRHRSGRSTPVMVTSNVVAREGRSTLIGLFHDLTEERRVAAELDAFRAKLAVFDDRDRIGRDLHDGVIQRLFAAGLQLQSSIGRPDQEARQLGVVDEIDHAIKEIRTTIFTLHGRRGLDSGLGDALRMAVAESSRLLGHHPQLEVSGPLGVLSDELGTEVLAVTRELLSNVVKHAQASQTTVQIDVDDAAVTLTVEDDGVGFEPDAVQVGLGVMNVHERAQRWGGTAQMTWRAPHGTVVQWSVPRSLSAG
jgi:PAS domain S-box-containing protein